VLTLTADKPAFFVTASLDMPGHFTDNAVTLLPGAETRLTFRPRGGAVVALETLQARLRVNHLRETF